MKLFIYYAILFTYLFGDRCVHEPSTRLRPDLELSYLSESAHFMIHYDGNGSNHAPQRGFPH